MNWIKENKFLTGFFAITLVGAGVLAFMVMGAKTRADEAQARYEQNAAKLSGLQNSAPYPDEGNRAQMEKKKKEHKAAIDELQRDLAVQQIPLDASTTQAQFQDKLKETVTRVKELAAQNNVKLPEKFYMSFDRYEAERPKLEAAAPLLRMLEAMETVINMLIAEHVSEISEIKHDPLPEEGGKTVKESKDKDKDKDGKALVVHHPFEIAFVGREGNFHKFINKVVTEKKQFYIPRSVTVKNEHEQGPSRAVPNKDKDKEAEVAIVVGEEKVIVTVKIDVVDFAGLPAAKGEKVGSPGTELEFAL